MIVFSAFDGMSCGQIALERLGFEVEQYYASEIDKWAIKVTQANYPDTVQVGDICNVHAKNLPKIDLLIGGSPCQGFSFAGKQLNFDDPRSALFFEFVRLYNKLKEKNPDIKFMLENVKMKKEYRDVISSYMGVQPIEINSTLVSAQNRRRLYWTNISDNIRQPDDLGIMLKDILQPEEEIEEKYYLSNKALERFNRKKSFKPKINPEKTGTLNTKNNSGQLSMDSGATLIKLNLDGGIKKNQDKFSCLTGGHRGDGNHSDMDVICVAMRGRNPENSNDRTAGSPTEQRLEPKRDGKTNTITTVSKDNLITDGYKLRRLTPIECERLQTVPDNYTNHVSNTQRYKMLGNGWTVDVIYHIFAYLNPVFNPADPLW